MAMQLDKVIPLFALLEDDLAWNIIGVGDGPASFNAKMHVLCKRVVSIGPLFVFGADDFERQFHAVADNIIDQVKVTPDD